MTLKRILLQNYLHLYITMQSYLLNLLTMVYIKAILKELQKLKHLTHKSKELSLLKCIF